MDGIDDFFHHLLQLVFVGLYADDAALEFFNFFVQTYPNRYNCQQAWEYREEDFERYHRGIFLVVLYFLLCFFSSVYSSGFCQR